jgi:hypothetical protein
MISFHPRYALRLNACGYGRLFRDVGCQEPSRRVEATRDPLLPSGLMNALSPEKLPTRYYLSRSQVLLQCTQAATIRRVGGSGQRGNASETGHSRSEKQTAPVAHTGYHVPLTIAP